MSSGDLAEVLMFAVFPVPLALDYFFFFETSSFIVQASLELGK